MHNPVCMGASVQKLLTHQSLTQAFHLETTPAGLWLKREQQPLAWIVPGYHQGRIAQQTTRCHFVDVAYYRQTNYGVNLETADFATLEQALAFLESTFCLGGAK